MKYLLIFLIALLFLTLSCKQSAKDMPKTSNCDSQIDSITALYYNYSFNSAKAIKCSDITHVYIPDFRYNSDGIYDVKITDCDVLKNIEKEINLLSPDTMQYSVNARIAVNIHYKNGNVKRICMNDNNPNDIFLDEVMQVTNNRLIFLIKNNIGYYSWFENPQDYETELKDTSFVKEPIVISPYYKQYQEMKANKN